jgi:hypothetical protein
MPDSIRITKLKFDGKKVKIEYEKPTAVADQWDKLSIISSEQPDPGLNQSLQALKDFVVDVCEFQQIEKRGMPSVKVLGISVSYDDKGKTALIVLARKTVKGAMAPFLFNTPTVPEPGSRKPCLLPDTVKILAEVVKQAKDYVDGVRGQMEIPLSVSPQGALTQSGSTKGAAPKT